MHVPYTQICNIICFSTATMIFKHTSVLCCMLPGCFVRNFLEPNSNFMLKIAFGVCDRFMSAS
jgi:hypothetical protein